MAYRTGGDTKCAHCGEIDTDRKCRTCNDPVCPRCGDNVRSCPDSPAWHAFLGLTAGVSRVDARARVAWVDHRNPWVGDQQADWRPRLFDLRRFAWLSELPILDGKPLLVTDRYALELEPPYLLKWYELTTGKRTAMTYSAPLPTVSGLPGVGFDGGFAYLDPTYSKVVVGVWERPSDLPRPAEPVALPPHRVEIAEYKLPHAPINAFAVDDSRDLLVCAINETFFALASYGIALYRMREGKLEHVSETITAKGTARWIAVAGDWLAVEVNMLHSRHIELRRMSPNLAVGPVVFRYEADRGRLSADGRYFARAEHSTLLLHDLETDTTTRYDDHEARIDQVRFASDDGALLTTDIAGNLILRPRTRSGYASTVVSVEVGR